jgi:2-dehydro-3-deoxygluconokinase
MTWPPLGPPLGEKLDVVGIGEALVLLQPPAGRSLQDADQLQVHVAGAELNVCAAVAAVGGRATLRTRLGNDPMGARIRDEARRLGVQLDAEEDPRRPTALFLKDVREDGLRRVHYYRRGSAASVMSAADADRAFALGPRCAVVSGLTIALGPGPTEMVSAVVANAARRNVALVLDVNLRPQLGRSKVVTRTILESLPAVDLLVIGTDEAAVLFGVDVPAAIATAATVAGCREVVIKGGAAGCWWVDESGDVHHEPSRASTVVDPVGAGDAFTGGYLATRLHGGTRREAAVVGSILAAAVVGSAGDTAGLPSIAGGRELMAQHVSSPHSSAGN